MRRYLEVVTGSVIGGLVALAVTLPALYDARRDADVADHERQLIQTKCTVFVDGSAACPAGLFEITTTKR